MTVQILVTGRMGSGKDVFADYLVSQHGFVKTAFADGIRRTIREYDPSYVLKSDRQKEIEVGNSFRRWFGDDYWIQKALINLSSQHRYEEVDSGYVYVDPVDKTVRPYMKTIPKTPVGYVISDGRFPLEYSVCVGQHGFVHVHIDAHADVRKKRLLARDGQFNEQHFYSPDDCQIPVTDSTVVIENNHSLTEFHQRIDTVIAQLKEAAI